MSYEKVVRVYCDGPNCQRSVYGETADEARRYAKYGQAWYCVRKFGLDICSEKCDNEWHEDFKRKAKEAEAKAEAPAGILMNGAPS